MVVLLRNKKKGRKLNGIGKWSKEGTGGDITANPEPNTALSNSTSQKGTNSITNNASFHIPIGETIMQNIRCQEDHMMRKVFLELF